MSDIYVKGDANLLAANIKSGASIFGVAGKLICFAVRRTSYTANGVYFALDGMTWAEWCDSEFNTAGFYIYGGGVITAASGQDMDNLAHDITNRYVTSAELVVNGEMYIGEP